jgi:hypothetical protein
MRNVRVDDCCCDVALLRPERQDREGRLDTQRTDTTFPFYGVQTNSNL